jgi:hypothetical protein
MCRFSLLVTNGFQKPSQDFEERRRELYDPLRLTTRMAWFEHVFMPSIRAQSDPDFHLVIATGEDYPEPWRGHLQQLVADVPQIELLFLPPGRLREVSRKVMLDRIDKSADIVAQFRLDDDDAVATDYVRRVRSEFEALAAPAFAFQPLVALDHCKGLALNGTGEEVSVHKVTASCWTPALTLFMPPDHEKSVFDYPHHLVYRHMTTLSLQDQIMFVRGVHGWNDSTVTDRNFGGAMEPGPARYTLRRRFGIEPDRLAGALKVASMAARNQGQA